MPEVNVKIGKTQVVDSEPIEVDLGDAEQVTHWAKELGVDPSEFVAAAKAAKRHTVQAIGEQLIKRSVAGPQS